MKPGIVDTPPVCGTSLSQMCTNTATAKDTLLEVPQWPNDHLEMAGGKQPFDGHDVDQLPSPCRQTDGKLSPQHCAGPADLPVERPPAGSLPRPPEHSTSEVDTKLELMAEAMLWPLQRVRDQIAPLRRLSGGDYPCMAAAIEPLELVLAARLAKQGDY